MEFDGSWKHIDIEIDGLTNCLIERATGKVVNTTVELINVSENDFSTWKFDWKLEAKKSVQIYALKIENSFTIQGLISTKVDKANSAVQVSLVESSPENIGRNGKFKGVGGHLFAEAVRQSMDAGFNGYVYFVAKTSLIEHYKSELGAKIAWKNVMSIDEKAAKELFEKYFGGQKNDEGK